MEKVLSKIGKFFKTIWGWIKNTAWVQPLLIVVIIFGLIFSIQPIVKWVKSISSSTNTTGQFYKDHNTYYYNLFEGKKYVKKADACLVVYVNLEDDSSKATANTLEAPLKNFYKAQNKKVKIYIVNVGSKHYLKHVKENDTYDQGKKYNNEIYDELKPLYETSLPKENFTYDITYPEWDDDAGYLNGKDVGSNPTVNSPTYVKYVNGTATDVRFDISKYTDEDGKTLEPITVLTDFWNGGNKATI